ncbi:MAG: DNA primase [Calditrichia bacterium]
MKIPEHLIDRIRDSVDIVEVVSRFLSLKKQGRNHVGLCPFHTEKTPSFTVSAQKQIFYCFGCGAGGNVINFLMRYEKISFLDAVKKLAEEAGIELPKFKADERVTGEYERLYRANQFAADFYHRMLLNQFARLQEYFEKRGIHEKTIKSFQLGYIPDEWDGLYREIERKKMGIDPFLKVGLLLRSEKDPEHKYDRFRNRIMFPIYNLSGRVVAFGGRTLSEEPNTPKYINSPESPIYQKGQVLFGLNFSKEWIRQEELAIFVEGYMDYLQLYQQGIKNVVATSGTALTEDQARLIRRYTTNVILCYDADSAGIEAAIRGGQILFQNNINTRVLILPDDEDPDSFVRKNGASAFRALLQEAKDYFTFRMERLLSTAPELSVSQQTHIVNELLDTLAALPDPLKANLYLNVLVEKFKLSGEALLSELQKKRKIYQAREKRIAERERQTMPTPQTSVVLSGAWSAEKDVLILSLNYFEKIKDIIFDILEPDDFLNDAFKEIFVYIQEHREKDKDELLHAVLASLEDEKILSLLTANLFQEIQNPDQYLRDCIEKIKVARYQHEIELFREKLKSLPSDAHDSVLLLAEINSRLENIRNIQNIFSRK